MKRHAEQISLWEWEFVSGDSKGMLRVMKGSEFTQTNTLLLHEAQIWDLQVKGNLCASASADSIVKGKWLFGNAGAVMCSMSAL